MSTRYKYAEVKDGVVTRRKAFTLDAPFDVAELKKGQDGLPFLRPVVVVKPAVDRATEVQEGPVTTISDTEVTDTWTNRPKTPAELDAETASNKQNQVDSFNKVLFEVLYDYDKRLRVIEGEPSKTKPEFKILLKGLI